MKIKHSLFLILLFFSLIPLYIFGGVMIYENDKKVEEVMKESLEAVSGSQILNIRNFCEARRESMEMVAQYELVRDVILVNLGEHDSEEVSATSRGYVDNLLRERKRYNTFIVSMSIVDKNFHVVSSSEEYTVNEDSPLKDSTAEFQSGQFFLGNVYERETPDGPKRVVAAYQGVFQGDEVIGYVVEEIETAKFDEFRLETELWSDGTFYILDGNSAVVTAGTNTEEGRTTLVSTKEERAGYIEAWDAIDHEKYPDGEIEYTYGGSNYITYYSDIAYTNWGIRITANLTSHKTATAEYRKILYMSAIMVSLMLLVINSLITKRLIAPINGIVKTLNKVEENQNYSLRVEEKRKKDEIGYLAGEVNQLLNYIEKENIHEKEEQRKLKRMAEQDPMTGVKNKRAIEQNILDMVQQASESGNRIIVGFLDIDDFRDYNTRYGHQEGDRVIQFVADTLSKNVAGVVGRNGGDEFVFCVSKELTRAEVGSAAQFLLKKLNEGFYSEKTGRNVPVPCSIGVVSDVGKDINYVTMIQKADEAMYTAKENGKNRYCLNYGEGTAED